MFGIKLPNNGRKLGEERGFMIGVFNRAPVLLVPGSLPADVDLVNGYVFDLGAMTVDRDGEPLGSTGCFDPVAIAPAPLIILDVIIEYEDIRFQDLVEVASPGDIGGLEDYTACHAPTPWSP